MMGGWGYGWFVMLTFWLLFVVGLVWLVTTLTRGGDGGARRILDERFAAGELTAEELRAAPQGAAMTAVAIRAGHVGSGRQWRRRQG